MKTLKGNWIFILIGILVLGLALVSCLDIGEDDDEENDGKSDRELCEDACDDLMDLCEDIDDEDECVDECRDEIKDLDDDEKDDALDCIGDADSCAEAIACKEGGHHNDGDVNDGDVNDGDVYDGDVYDGDVYDGDVYDGDVNDAICEAACFTLMQLCDELDDLSDCLMECEDTIYGLTEAEIQAALNCINSAYSCEEAMECGWEDYY